MISLILLHIFILYLNNFALKLRNKKKDLSIEISRIIVRLIMSKNEIVQNNKTKQEISLVQEIGDKQHIYNLRLNDYLR
jgi:hypothetical protein